MKEYTLTIQTDGQCQTTPLGKHVSERDALLHALSVIDNSVETLVYITKEMTQKARLSGLTPGWYVKHAFGPDTYCGDSSNLDDVLLQLAKSSPNANGVPASVTLTSD